MYYIVDKNLFMQHRPLENSMGAQWVDLPDGIHVFVKVVWRNDFHTKRFESHQSVKTLPHKYNPQPIGLDIAKHLSHLDINETHSTMNVLEKIAIVFPAMKCE